MMISRAKLLAALIFGLAGLCLVSAADEPKPAKSGVLIIVDGAGKEHKVKEWKFAAGTRHLAWLAPAEKPAPAPKPDPKAKAPRGKAPPLARPTAGPEALEFRDEQSTTFVDGILTLVPLDRLRSLEYDYDKKSVTLKAAGADGKDEVLTGTTKYRGINHPTIDAEVDRGDMGLAEVKFIGGAAKGGIRGVTFPTPKAPAADKGGRAASITIGDKQKSVQKAVDLLALYRLPDGSERVLSVVMFKKTFKVDLAKVKKLRTAEAVKGEEPEWVVTFKDGEEQTLSLLKTIPLEDQQATLIGFVGRVPAGYKLFPPHTVAEIQFDEAKPE